MKIVRNIGIFIACCGAGWVLWKFWNYIQGNGDYAASTAGIQTFSYLDMVTSNIGNILIILLAVVFVLACILGSRGRG